MARTKKRPSTFRGNDLCGISEKRADEIISDYKHAKIDADTWQDSWDLTIENAEIKTKEEYAYLGFIFGRKIEESQSPASELLDMLEMVTKLKGGGSRGIGINADDLPADLKKILIDHLSGKHKH